jgi:hypothetical protein
MSESSRKLPVWSALGADGVALSHALFVGFVVWGEVLILVGSGLGWEWVHYLRFRLAHLLPVLFVGVQDLMGRVCPLTTWEEQLRRRAGQAVDSKPFIGRLVHRLLMCHLSEQTQRRIRLAFAAVVLITFVLLPPGGATRGP